MEKIDSPIKKPKLNGEESKNEPLNDHINVSSDFYNKFSLYYHEKTKLNYDHSTTDQFNGKSHVITSPYLAGSISNVFKKSFLKKLEREISQKLSFKRMHNDLYEFYQSRDLNSIALKNLKKLKDTIYGERFLNFLSGITRIELNNTLDISVSKYIYGDHLLAHDDDIQNKAEGVGRRIAFILYLVDEDWDEKDGGALELFNRDEFGNPTENNNIKLLPIYNQMIFFEIGTHSYHQVCEVTSKMKDRLSIVGWFHGTVPTLTPQIVDYKFLKVEYGCQNIENYINSEYLKPEVIDQICFKFKTEETLELKDFLNTDFYKTCIENLFSNSLVWSEKKGPSHVRRYSKGIEMPESLEKVNLILKSKEFTLFLSRLVGLNLTLSRGELRRFERGDYTLLNDLALEPSGIDIILSLCDQRDNALTEERGGGLHYLKDGVEKAVHLPKFNSIMIFKRDINTLRFVKYLKTFCDFERIEFAFTYCEE